MGVLQKNGVVYIGRGIDRMTKIGRNPGKKNSKNLAVAVFES